MTVDLKLDDADWASYDFVDLGCSDGGSLKHCMRRFGAKRGAGIDIDPKKIARARQQGFDAYLADATSLDLQRNVSFISMMNFLEHIPNIRIVEDIIGAAAKSARDFLYIRNPSFEGESISEFIGYRQYWWNWRHHPCHPTVADYCGIFDRLGLRSYTIRYTERITDTSHATIIPVGMPPNVNAKTAEQTKTPPIPLPTPWWRRQDIFVALRPFERDEWSRITQTDTVDKKYAGEAIQ